MKKLAVVSGQILVINGERSIAGWYW